VDNDLHVIEHDPLARGKSVHRNRADAMLISQASFDLARDCFQMRLRSSRANHEVIGEAGNPLEIENDDVFRLLVGRAVGAGFG
jgi:hypothetical protein